MRTISIDLTDDQATFFDDVAATGEYATPGEAILDAMEEWQARRQVQLLSENIERVRQLWDEGIASGSAGEMDFVAHRQEARRRLANLMERAA